MKKKRIENVVPDLSILDLAEHGLKYCPDCNGYGSCLKDLSGNYRCVRCGGKGAIPLGETS
jgi:hypothetical protein